MSHGLWSRRYYYAVENDRRTERGRVEAFDNPRARDDWADDPHAAHGRYSIYASQATRREKREAIARLHEREAAS